MPRAQTFLLDLSDALRPLGDAREVQMVAARMLGAHLEVERALYFEVLADLDTMVAGPTYLRGVGPMPASVQLSDFGEVMHHAYLRGENFVAADVLAHPHFRPSLAEAYAQLEIRAAVGVPLLKDGKLVAVMSVHASTVRAWSQAEVALVEEVAERTWSAVERAHVEAALRKLEARQSYLLHLSDTIRRLGDAADIERAACRILGSALGANRVFYASIEPDEDTGVIRAGYADGIDSGAGRYSISAFTAQLTQEWKAGRTTVTNDVDTDPRYTDAERAAFASVSTRSAIGVPLLKDEKLVVLLGINHATPRVWTEDEVLLVQETAERTWAAVARSHVETTLRESEKRARALAEQASAARAEAESANRAKDEFLATLSHELRTPLAAILLWTGALRSGAVGGSDVARAIDAIASSAESQSRLIDDLLDLSRLTANKLTLAIAPTDVTAVVREAAEMVAPTMTAGGLSFDVRIAPDVGVAALDGQRLKQILGNLLTNAAKFTPSQGKVSLTVARRDGALEVEVADTGDGIEPALLPHLFERFWQRDMGETRKHAGLRIRLALSKQLVLHHGGAIRGESDGPGRGARFTFRIPWQAAEAHERDRASATAPAAPWTGRPLVGLVVLLVENDASNREPIEWMLVRAGATVVPVPGALEALDAIDGVDVVVSDIGLPGIDGLELMQRIVRIRKEQGRSPPPACAVSAHARDADRQNALAAGFDMYLVKPVTAAQLIEAVVDLRDVVRSEANDA